MFRTAPPPIDGRQAGFTMIEVLIALAVVAVGIVAVGSVMSTNVRGVRSLEQHLALVQTARNAMATEIPPRAELGPGVLSGQLNDYRWQVDIGPLGGGWAVASEEVDWIPQLVKIHVQSPTGAAFDLQTVRLMHRPRQ
ncbi:MAG TPA: prepilin-type N-terminal cleavage/methylation domain-containing protein [Bradyrhizobium sp.]|nr:prepilin-type N-terminal cleavage/methylation domain-containing protein [Bradyrhizobium sp.]